MMAVWMIVAMSVMGVAAKSSESSLETLLGRELNARARAKRWLDATGNNPENSLEENSTGGNTTVAVHSRRARQLIDLPDAAVMEINFKLVTPYGSYGGVSTKGDYRLEITFELPNEIRRRRKRSTLASERSSMYDMFSDFITKAGLDGQTCVLRAVCEIGEKPLDEFGLFGEFINLIFAPGFNAEEGRGELFQDHIQAEEYGRSFGNCWSAFPDCPISMREMLYEFFISNSDVPLKSENDI